MRVFLRVLLCVFVVSVSVHHDLSAQPTLLRADVAITKSRIIGVDKKEMINNGSWAAGILYSQGSGIWENHGRWYVGGRVRHLQAEQIVYGADSSGQYLPGTESYRYNYAEVPLGVEFDLLAGSNNYFNIGIGTEVFGAIPFGVKGVRDYPGANPWSKEYETPFFILGFGVSGYVGINIKPIGIKVHYAGQFPFIPIAKPAPDTYTGPEYKIKMLGNSGLMISVFYFLSE
jgi:hypothetical protein